jgi:phospholipid-binding lipoprotein MlaA
MISSHYVQKLRFSLIILSLSGCASTTLTAHPEDPYEAINRRIYNFNESFDRYTLKPLAQGYQAVMPSVGKVLVNNFFSNLDDVEVTLNDFLQLKVKQGFSDGT